MRVNINWLKIITVIGVLEQQLSKALEDGEISTEEAMGIILTILSVLDIKIKK